MKNILWLTEWFPSSFEPFNGDGIERRGKAASLHHNITVIYVKKKPGLRFGKIETEERSYGSHYKAFLYFYPSIRKFNRFLDIVLSNYYFFKLHLKAIRDFKRKYNKPDGIQVNVAMKNGVIALLCKWFWHMDYIVVEGWGLFLPESIPKFKDKSWLFRFFTRQVFKQATLVITVSNHLGKMIRAHIADVPYKVIPSVVDRTIFYPAEENLENKIFRFIHISNLDYSKNIQQILSGLKQFLETGRQAELVIHAPNTKTLFGEIALLNLERHVIIKEEAPQALLADSIRSSDALILFSLYETFGNVVIEAQACGVPVITSDYPTFFETIENGVNGIIAKGKNAGALAEAMINCIADKRNFDSKRISEKAFSSYSFELIGKMFDEVYTQYF
jgi:glycosyltransferase involved in cell wall biosynthesis